ELPWACVLNRVQGGTRENQAMAEQLAARIDIVPTVLGNRIAYERATASGKCSLSYRPKDPAGWSKTSRSSGSWRSFDRRLGPRSCLLGPQSVGLRWREGLALVPPGTVIAWYRLELCGFWPDGSLRNRASWPYSQASMFSRHIGRVGWLGCDAGAL